MPAFLRELMPSREAWDRRFASGSHTSSTPSGVVVRSRDYWALLPPGERRALDVAAGAGRNALFLAGEGFAATALDWSEIGFALLRERAAEAGLAVSTRVEDLESESPHLGGPYELVVVSDFLHRPLLKRLRDIVSPGGLIAYETFSYRQRDEQGGPSCDDYLLGPNELLDAFSGWRVLHYQETLPPTAKASLIVQAP